MALLESDERIGGVQKLGVICDWPSSRSLHGLIGRIGYTCPNLDQLRRLSAREASTINPNLIVSGENLDSNWILAPTTLVLANKLQVGFGKEAKHSVLVLGAGADISGVVKFNGQYGVCVFGEKTVHTSSFYVVLSSQRTTFFFGEKGSSNGLNVFITGDDRSVIIGDDCMVAQRPSILTSDIHAIVDLNTREWLNEPADVVIEPHVWLGMDAFILKGCKVGFGTVVGATAVVTKSVPRLSMVVGSPAKVIRTNIGWIRPLTPSDNAIENVIRTSTIFAGEHSY